MERATSVARPFTLVVVEGLVLMGVGFLFDLAGAVAIRGAMTTQLYGVGALDPTVILSVTFILGLVALVACVVPARRAARIDPIVALSEQ